MAKQIKQIIPVGDGEKFTLTTTNSETGKVTDSATFESDKPFKTEQLATALNQEVKGAVSRRVMWLSLLGYVMADPKLDGYKGQGDKSTGKLPEDFKKSVRTCEENYLRALCDKGHVKLHVSKDENPEKIFQQWATSIREDKNYSNIKSTVLRYYAIVGSHPVTPSGYLVPAPIMQAAIQTVLDANRVPTEDGYYSKVNTIFDEFNKDKSPDMEDVAKLGRLLKQFLGTVEGILTHEAEMSTAALAGLKTADVKDTSDKAIESAKATLASTKKQPADAPKNPVKAKETT